MFRSFVPAACCFASCCCCCCCCWMCLARPCTLFVRSLVRSSIFFPSWGPSSLALSLSRFLCSPIGRVSILLSSPGERPGPSPQRSQRHPKGFPSRAALGLLSGLSFLNTFFPFLFPPSFLPPTFGLCCPSISWASVSLALAPPSLGPSALLPSPSSALSLWLLGFYALWLFSTFSPLTNTSPPIRILLGKFFGHELLPPGNMPLTDTEREKTGPSHGQSPPVLAFLVVRDHPTRDTRAAWWGHTGRRRERARGEESA